MARQLKNQAGGWLPCAWEEYVGQDSSHGASFSSGWDDGSQSTFQILIPWQSGLDAELALLGSANFNGTSLTRTLPARHPYKGSMYAERILSAQPVHWDHKSNGFQAGFNVTIPLSEYSYWLLTIGFITDKWRVLSDAQLLNKYGAMQEWQRFCITQNKTNIQMLSREASMWQWSDGPHLGGQLVAPVGVGIYSADLIVTWKRVPRRGLYAKNGEYDFFNQNIANCRNKLHDGTTNLWGYVTGAADATKESNASSSALRFIDAEAVPIPSPFDPSAQGLGALDYNLYVDVNFHFSVWQPPAGNPGFQGWNLTPDTDNAWYLIKTRQGGNRIFQTTDLSTVFQLSAT